MKPVLPANASVLVLAGPRRTVNERKSRIAYRPMWKKAGMCWSLLSRYTDRTRSLLARWGLGLGPGVLVDLQDRLAQGDLTALLSAHVIFTEHEITQD